jgi:ABC-type polysaccharide/polyol phosphate export permease
LTHRPLLGGPTIQGPGIDRVGLDDPGLPAIRAQRPFQEVLPFYSMAEVIRAGLTVGVVSDVTQSFLVLSACTVAGCAVTAWVIGRRR